MNLTQTGIVENKRLSLRGNAINVSFRISAGDDVAVAIDRHRDDVRFVGIIKGGALTVRCYTINRAFITGPHEQPSLLIEKQRPDILGLRIEKLLRRAVLDFVDLPVRRSTSVQDILVVNSKREDIQFGEAHKHGAFSG